MKDYELNVFYSTNKIIIIKEHSTKTHFQTIFDQVG